MAKRGRNWRDDEDGLPDLDLDLDHGHDHDSGGEAHRFFGSPEERRRQLDRDRVRDDAFDHERDLDAKFERQFRQDASSASPPPPAPERTRKPKRTFSDEVTPGSELDDEISFHHDLHEVTPHVVFTWLFIGANLAIFALLVGLYQVPFMMPGAEDLKPWGANFAPLTTSGEWWRLFTCMFLHFGLLHIAFNMWILKEIGPLVERLVGNVGFLILYLGSGLVASLASTWWNPHAVGAGASGAIFGVIGALLGVLILGHGTIPKASLSRLRKSVTTFVAFNVWIGLKSPGIDMAAHLGGLGMGVVCGMIMTRSEMLDTPEGRGSRDMTAAAVCGLAMMWMLVLIPDVGGDPAATLRDFDVTRVRTDAQFDAARTDGEVGRMDDEAWADIVEGLLLELQRVQRNLAGLKDADAVQAGGIERAQEYLGVRIEGWEALVEGLRGGDAEDFTLWNNRERQAERLEHELR